MRHDEQIAAATFAEIGDELDVTWQAVQVAVSKAQRKIAAELLRRLGPAVVDLARDDEPVRHDDPRVMR